MKIIFTGGGTAGHISLNMALIPFFVKRGYEVHYIGSKNGMEKNLISDIPNVIYHEISTGKLRRYSSKENCIDFFRVIKGIMEATKIIKNIKPNVVFSKGGFVSFPVVVGAKINHIPTIIHESDLTVGLANKLSFPFCDKIFLTFKDEENMFEKKGEYVGAIFLSELNKGKKERAMKMCHFTNSKPNILVMGGSSGVNSINKAIRNNLDILLKNFNIIHICGKGSLDNSIKKKNYVQYEFLKKELADIFALSDMVISRAGSNSIFEFLYVKLPMLLIPLTKKQSRGDQIENANYFKNKGYCDVIEDEKINSNLFIEKIMETCRNADTIKKNMDKQDELGNINELVKKIIEISNKNNNVIK